MIKQSRQTTSYLSTLIPAWQEFLEKKGHWQILIKDTKPKINGCGMIYELPNFLKRTNEDFAIADMRQIEHAEPHYHPKNNYEFYFVLQGTGTVIVGTKKRHVNVGDVVIIPPMTAHFTIPDKKFVIGLVNTPPFRPENYIVVSETKESVAFDQQQFAKLCLS